MTRHRLLHDLGTVLIVAGVLLLIDAGLTVAWQEPVSGVYQAVNQARLGGDLRELETATPSALEQRALDKLRTQEQRMAFLARSERGGLAAGDAIGRIRAPAGGIDDVIVNGTDPADLRKGPGLYEQTPMPGAGGTAAIAGHRTTYGAPFRHIDDLKRGDSITVTMPYGEFTYEVVGSRIVKPSEVSVIKPVGYDRLVLTACHPLYSAAKRLVVFARQVDQVPRGAARDV